jgi:hypothetical protein
MCIDVSQYELGFVTLDGYLFSLKGSSMYSCKRCL